MKNLYERLCSYETKMSELGKYIVLCPMR